MGDKEWVDFLRAVLKDFTEIEYRPVGAPCPPPGSRGYPGCAGTGCFRAGARGAGVLGAVVVPGAAAIPCHHSSTTWQEPTFGCGGQRRGLLAAWVQPGVAVLVPGAHRGHGSGRGSLSAGCAPRGLTARGPQVAMQSLWNIKVVVLVKPEHENRISHVSTSSVKTGIANTLGRWRGARPAVRPAVAARGTSAWHRGGSRGTCVARGGLWARVRCTRQGFGACALHKVEPWCVYITQGVLWVHESGTGRALGARVLHGEGCGHVCIAQGGLWARVLGTVHPVQTISVGTVPPPEPGGTSPPPRAAPAPCS